MDEKEIVARLSAGAFVAEPGAVSDLAGRGDCDDLISRVEKKLAASNAFVVTKKLVDEVLGEKEIEQKSAAAVVVVEATNYKPPAKDIQPRLKMRGDLGVPAKSTCGGGVEDFVEYFRDRFRREAGLLRGRMTRNPLTQISKIQANQGGAMRIVGIVADKRETKNGHVLIELEDETGAIKCLVSKNAQPALKQQAADVVYDEVIAIDGTIFNDLFIAREITWPETTVREKRLADEDVAVAFISDLHVGSRFFLQEHFHKFMRFLKGEGTEEEKAIAGKIKYLFVAGDLVDGIGVYPSQEKELVTKDIYMQYEIFSEMMKLIPEYIEVVIIPGNHDAVRIAEPQPALGEEFTKTLSGYSNIHFAGNPAYAEVHGLTALLYHGSSLFSMVESEPSLAGGYNNPEKVGVELLKKRHLSPIYGTNPIVPERKDYLVIEEVPDIFHFGHVHKNGYETYRGTMIINSGTWQDITDYQIKQGHVPSPCQLPIYNLASGSLKVTKFKD